jgi:hypothetical protein
VMHIVGGAMFLTGTRHAISILNSCIGLLLLASCGLWCEAYVYPRYSL